MRVSSSSDSGSSLNPSYPDDLKKSESGFLSKSISWVYNRLPTSNISVNSAAQLLVAGGFLAGAVYTVLNVHPENPNSPDFEGGMGIALGSAMMVSGVTAAVQFLRGKREDACQWLVGMVCAGAVAGLMGYATSMRRRDEMPEVCECNFQELSLTKSIEGNPLIEDSRQILEIFSREVIYDSKPHLDSITSFCSYIQRDEFCKETLVDMSERQIENLALNGLLYCKTPMNDEIARKILKISFPYFKKANENESHMRAPWDFQAYDLASEANFESALLARTEDVLKIVKRNKMLCCSGLKKYAVVEPTTTSQHSVTRKILSLQRNLGDQ